MSSTSSTPTTTNSQGPSSSNQSFPGGNLGTSGNTSLYLFTFLITIVVLGTIAAGLLVRAYIVRRRFQRRVEDALREGRPLPPDMAMALGLIRPGQARNAKKEKKVGKMPVMWESEMWRDEKRGQAEAGGEDWNEIMVRVGHHLAHGLVMCSRRCLGR